MIPEWALKYLGEEGVAETDPKSGWPIAWGRQVIEDIPEDRFDDLRGRIEVTCVFPDWFVVERRLQFSDLLMKHGGVRQIGLGPGGGFKWVVFADDSKWGHLSFKNGALREIEKNERLHVKCDKDGNELEGGPRQPRRAMGRASTPRATTGGRRRR